MGGGLVVQAEGGGGGGQNQTCFITRALMGSPHTTRPPQVPRESPITLFLPLLKFCSISAKKQIARRNKMSEYFLLARNVFFSTEYFFFSAEHFFCTECFFLCGIFF